MKFKPLISSAFIFFIFVSFLSAHNTYVTDDNFEQTLTGLGYDLKPSLLSLKTNARQPFNQSFPATSKYKTSPDIVPWEEYNALVNFYNNTHGEEWINNSNWLDTANVTINDWFGVTVTNGHVTKLELPNNNLRKNITENSLNFPELLVLDISGNSIDEITTSDLGALSKLNTLNVKRNNFLHHQINAIINLSNYNNFKDNFTYIPQNKADSNEYLNFVPGETIEVSLAPSLINEENQFQWYKNGTAIEGANNYNYIKTDADFIDAGTYYVEVYDNAVPDLIIQSNDKYVQINNDPGVPSSEVNALIELYNVTGGANWINKTNWPDTTISVDNWHGVKISNGHVIELQLNNNNLTGEISESIGNLSYLQVLNLSSNNLTGHIPSGLNKLQSLNYLWLSDNKLSGLIPPEIDNMLNLKFLSLANNKLEGNIPTSLGNLKKLEIVYCNKNAIEGTIPSEIGQMSSLSVLDLSNNKIHGPLPVELKNLNNLVTLNLERNQLGSLVEGITREARQIPDEIGDILSLKNLLLSYNSIQFNDLESIFSWENISQLTQFSYKYQNGLHSYNEKEVDVGESIIINLQNYYPAPSDKYQWVKASNSTPLNNATAPTLTIDNVQLSDEATYYCVITNSKVPDLSITNYSTTLKVKAVHGAGIPLAEYKTLEKLFNTCNGINWNYKQNWLDTTNYSVKDWTGVKVINGHVLALMLDSNNVVGQLPVELYNLRYIEDITLTNNRISGRLDENIQQLSNLKILSLAMNNLSGNLPAEISELKQLYWLGLSNNSLSGALPDSLSKCKNLEGISLAHNMFESEIPSSLGNLSKLRHLHLNNNNLTGLIPASLGNLSELRVLNLSNNQLIGPVPTELNNLKNVYRLDLSGNLFGTTESTKSAKLTNADDYRQIPDALAGLMDMDTFRLGGNNLQFNDIEAIFSWENFSDFNDFVYSPQGIVGVDKTIKAEEEETVTLIVDNYYAGTSDKYKWFKNGVLLPNETDKEITFENLQKQHAGVYHCIINNLVATELELTSANIKLEVIDKQPGAGVPNTEYQALVELHNQFANENWNNWLDTLSGTVNEWLGVTVENGHVVAIDLSGLNIEGEVFDIFSAFDSLTWLNLSNNKLSGRFPTFDGSKSENINSVKENAYTLTYLNIANNNFVFSDMEPVANELLAIDTFIYSPQQLIGFSIDTSIYKNNSMNIKIEGFVGGSNDSYKWIKDNDILSNRNEIYFIDHAELKDSGIYILQVENNIFPELTLISEPYKLSVLTPVGVNNIELKEISLYPNPANERIFIDTQNLKLNLKVLDLVGKVVFEKPDFTNGWITIGQFPKGVYLFRFETENSRIINKKVIFK
uniref:T9SS type A sorting domain-containing protein n=1 Tax=uncultured Draconibacterium sp. TaxID=1573823 RepID=UPI003216A0E0